MTQRPFVALQGTQSSLPLLVVDIGYAAKNKSCGLAWTDTKKQVQFGQALTTVAEKINQLSNVVLVLEAPISTFHNHLGNPATRGEFERRRGWYQGAGAVVTLAAQRFLQQLTRKLHAGKKVYLAEAFLSHKQQPSAHGADAAAILERFWETEPIEFDNKDLEPINDLIEGIPPVRVF